jgi:hypothetical protein
MRYCYCPVLILAAGFSLVVPSRANAVIVVADSIEWVIADSDRVVAGNVVSVERVAGPGEKPFEVATVEVSKTFKGEHVPRVTFILRNYNGSAVDDWLADGIPLLFCLVNRDRAKDGLSLPEGFDWVLRDDGNEHSAVLLGKPKRHWTHTIRVVTRDFNVLTDPSEILNAAEAASEAHPKRWEGGSTPLEVPDDTPAMKELWCRSAVYLIVPLDDELERSARRWCNSDRPGLRFQGARVLRLFNNERNVKLLKALLQDPSFFLAPPEAPPNPGQGTGSTVPVRHYSVRKEAYDSLQALGVDVDPPVFEEPAQPTDQVVLGFQRWDRLLREDWRISAGILIASATAITAAVAGYIRVRRKQRIKADHSQ